MQFSLRGLTVLLALPVLLATASQSHAQVVYTTPAYYYTPTVSYYTPAVSYYTPAVSYYTPAVSYYAAPAVSYYTPAVSYYAPYSTTTTYRYGILPRRQVSVTNYYTPTYVVP